MKVAAEDHAVGESDVTPPKKKLKQARLPFQVLSPAVVESSPDTKINKKRKLSEGSVDDIKVLKVIKPNETESEVEIKENLYTEEEGKELASKISSNSIPSVQNEISNPNVQETSKISFKSKSVEPAIIDLSDSDDEEVLLSETPNKTDNPREDESKTPVPTQLCVSQTTPQVNSSKADNKQELKLKPQKIVTEQTVNTNRGPTFGKGKHGKTSKSKGKQKKNKVTNHSIEDNRATKFKVADPCVSPKICEEVMQTEHNSPTILKVKETGDGSPKLNGEKIEVNEQQAASEVEDKCCATSKPVLEKLQSIVSDEDSDYTSGTAGEDEKRDTTPEPRVEQSNKRKSNKVSNCDVNANSSSPQESCTQGLRTPKRDQAMKQNHKLIDCTSNESVDVSPELSTPKQKSPDTDSTSKLRKLTPKQVQKQVESTKKKDEKEKQKQEREKKKAEEKEEKQRQKLEKEEQRKKEKEEKEEQRKKEKEEKEEQKKKEREEKEKKRLAEIEMKTEEKKVKEEERRKKDEQRLLEKRKKDEKKQAEEDAKRKEAAAFTSFFRASKSDLKPTEEVKEQLANFMPFEVKADMRLAPLVRTSFDSVRRQSLDVSLTEQLEQSLYLNQLNRKNITVGSCDKTWPLSELMDDVIIIDDEDMSAGDGDNLVVESHPSVCLPRPKLLQFWENQRPPYWGTWRKKSIFIRPTVPFGKDEKLFDYEVDSDDEWEEEEPGESLHGSDDEKESEDEYEVDNEFFVPHGYLSDEENECEGDEALSPETQKAKLKILELEFEEEMKHKTERIKPRVIGCIWANKNTDPVGTQLLKLLNSRRAVYRDGPIICPAADTGLLTGSPRHENQTDTTHGPKKRKFPDAATPSLIKLVHGNSNGRGFLVKEFFTYWREQESLHSKCDVEANMETTESEVVPPTVNYVGISKKSIANKIKEIATYGPCPDEGPMLGRMCWYVSSDLRSCYKLDDLSVPNKVWNYSLTPKRREIELQRDRAPSPAIIADSSPKSSKKLPLITKFTKKLSQKELRKQFELTGGSMSDNSEIKPDVKSPSPHLAAKTQTQLKFFKSGSNVEASKESGLRKRVPILMSVAIGQDIPKSHNQKSLTTVSVISDVEKLDLQASCESSHLGTTSENCKTKLSSLAIDEDFECVVLSD